MEERGKRIARKWRVIKLGREKREAFIHRFIQRLTLEIPQAVKVLEAVAFEYGEEEGRRIVKELSVTTPADLIDTVLMLHGAKANVSERESEDADKIILIAEIESCPEVGGLSDKNSCLAYLRGVIRAADYESRAKANCPFGEKGLGEGGCMILIEAWKILRK